MIALLQVLQNIQLFNKLLKGFSQILLYFRETTLTENVTVTQIFYVHCSVVVFTLWKKLSCQCRIWPVYSADVWLYSAAAESLLARSYTVKNAIELLYVTLRNTSLMSKKYNGNVEILCLSTQMFFPHSFIE
jgi:hypothetical protein